MSERTANKMAINTIWNALERFSQMGIQLVCTFILARFLTPTDFGLLGMIIVFTEISRTLIDSGFTAALIRSKEVTEEDYCSVFYLNITIGAILYIILFLSTGLIADFYHQPIFRDMCKVSFLIIPIFSFQVVHNAIFDRTLQFKKKGLLAVTASIISSLIAIFLAYRWRNVWALVIQNLSTYLVLTVLYWLFGSWRPKFLFSWKSISKYFNFSKNLLLSSLIGSVFSNINALLIGRFYTPSDLGYYSQANRLNMVASNQTTNIIKSVSYPILSQVNNRGGNLKEGYKKVIKISLLFVGLIMVMIMAIARDLIVVLMGSEEWRIAGNYLMILSFCGMLFPLHSINENILRVTGNSKTLLYLEVCRRLLLLSIIFITVQFSVTIFVLGYAIYSFLLVFLNLHVCGKPINYSLMEQLIDISPIVLRLLSIIVFALVLNYVMSDTILWVRMISVFISSLIFVIILFYSNSSFVEIIGLLRDIVIKKK